MRSRRCPGVVVVLLLVAAAAVVEAQFALVSPAFSSPFAAPLVRLRPGGGFGGARGGAAPLPQGSRLPASPRESEIAAIFRGVAYGAPTTARPAAAATPAGPRTTAAAPSEAYSTAAPAATTATPATTTTTTTTSPPATTTTTPTPASRRAPQEVEVSWAGRGARRPTEAYELAANMSQAQRPARGTEAGVRGAAAALGAAWTVHVFGSVAAMAAVAAAALCCLAHAALTPPPPRPPRLAGHGLAAVFAALRCLSLLQDPYGARGALPPAAAAALWEAAWPCLGLALVLLALALARDTRHALHARPHAAHALTLLTALHAAAFTATRLAASLLPRHAAPLRAAAHATAATWGGAVGGCVLWAAWRLGHGGGGGRGLQLLGLRASGRPAPAPTLAATAGAAQLLLAALSLGGLAAPPAAAQPWAWWTLVSLCRGLEAAAAAAVVAATFLLGRAAPPAAARRGDATAAVFSVLGEARHSLKGRHVFPAPRHALKPPPPPQWAAPAATHDVTADFTLAWPRQEGGGGSMLVQESGFVRFRTQQDGAPPPAYTLPAAPPPYTAATLPPPPARYYCRPCSSLPRPRRPSATAARRARDAAAVDTTKRRHQTLPSAPAHERRPQRLPPQYQVAPYTLPPPPPPPAATHTYATPLRATARVPASPAEQRGVDYLTDASAASGDGYALSLSLPRRPDPPAARPLTLTLPLTPHAHTDASTSSTPFTPPSLPPPLTPRPPAPSPNSPRGGTPDSGFAPDFSPQQAAASPAGRPSLLYKLVGGGMGGYAPLHVDDASPPHPRCHPGTPAPHSVTPV
ncbi:nascent polypeptide-associated complex subunit alpha, muscle-specific form-like [Eriocheir sinensis]|uniref:nascent polypeptide-associated complex subunit alpha, muscle-specific form-like n=1 Tax=Eriocheir sinensis TaxID=95602 RepID=UPI0021C64A97|nr:nascent polypeptide-associated complex subunit alpha, muscle-specific form-like [Eriocheir sinensis]